MFGLVGNMLIKVNHPLLLLKGDRENEETPTSPTDDAERKDGE